jgi:hypothetical protein
METIMKIKITPHFLTGIALDSVTESAVMKSNLPRARKIATATNLLSLLAQHYGTARPDGKGTATDRWLDCTPGAEAFIIDSNCLDTGVTPYLKSDTGILTVESHVYANSEYKNAYQHIRLHIPLNPADTVRLGWGKYGYFADYGTPCAVYLIEIG